MSVVRSVIFGAILGGLGGLALCYALGIALGVVNIFTNPRMSGPAECIQAGLFFIGFQIGFTYGIPVGGFVGFFVGMILGCNGLVTERPEASTWMGVDRRGRPSGGRRPGDLPNRR